MAKRNKPRHCGECLMFTRYDGETPEVCQCLPLERKGTCYGRPMPEDMMACVLFEERDDGKPDSASD